MRRASPRRLAAALDRVAAESAPATLLARAQASWPQAVGATVASEAAPVAENDGVLTVSCRSAVWAQELELLGPDILSRLNEALAGAEDGPLTGLRTRVGSGTHPAGPRQSRPIA